MGYRTLEIGNEIVNSPGPLMDGQTLGENGMGEKGRELDLDIGEALRYAGVGEPVPEELRLKMERVAQRVNARVRPRYTYRVFPLERGEHGVVLVDSGVTLGGKMAKKMLAQCAQAALLVCTLGEPFEALLRREQARDMAQAVMMDACGSALVEGVCDQAERELAERFPTLYLTDRFSPGYGDLELSVQPDICSALDAARRVGVHVTDSFLLNPSKSVTAVIGLSDRPQAARIRGCDYCAMRENCALRKRGTSCAI